ncbi:cyclin-D5-1-like [Mangifera indica]|uniref:cyclin-D5-1-like n=1 Tax=Mangifera indica TaxID=29780 RepID=UPI001CF9B99E|nr:cyclin-D5-1-like [Mangifera indica]
MYHLILFVRFYIFFFLSVWIHREKDMDDDSFSELLCQETETSLNEELVDGNFYNLKDYSVLDDEYMKLLDDKEVSFGFKKDKSLVHNEEIRCARLEAIEWILKTRAVFGFHFQTACLSVTYFDRFLSKLFIDMMSVQSEKSWAIKLLSVACLSLAAKMEETKVPALSEFQMEEYNFESRVILKMELLVLTTLDWRMGSITPFTFLPYFITKLCQDPPNDIISRTATLVLAIMREINLMDYRPSTIAAAATLVALDERPTRKTLEWKMNSISSGGFLEIEDVMACYSIIQKLEMQNSVKSPGQSPNPLIITNVLDGSSVSSAVGTKRKRLTFNESDQSCDIPNEKRFS